MPSREQKMADIRATYAAWAYGDEAQAESLPRPPRCDSRTDIVSPPIALDAAENPLALVQGAERSYRLMILRERDVEFCVMADTALDGYEGLKLEATEATARYWVSEDERSAFESIGFLERSAYSVAACSVQLQALGNDEEAAREALAEQRLEDIKEIEAEERPQYLAARRLETARQDAERSRASTPIPLTPTPPASTPSRAPSGVVIGNRAPAAADSGVLAPRPPVTGGRREARINVAFVLDCERKERAALLDGRDAFVQAVGEAMGAMHGAVPTLLMFSVERDEDIERRAIAGAYFDMLISAARIIEALRRREIDLKERRREMAGFVPRENEAWLTAKQRQGRRHVIEEQNEVVMEQARRDAIHDREQRETAERRAASGTEVAARVEMLHVEASERAILWAQAESEWRQLRESEIRAELDRQHKASTLVWTEEAHGVCIVDERRLRRCVLDEEGAARRELRGSEMSKYMQARRAEGLNIDVAKSLARDYDDKAAAIAQKKAAATSDRAANVARPADAVVA